MPESRQPIRCDCHGTEVVAEKVGDAIVIRCRRHGQIHTVKIDLTNQPKSCNNNN